jgi:acetyl-CoA carboxylase carboxyl transferase subunit alpha
LTSLLDPLQENIRRNFGMPQPNGYRKAMRFMRHANKFGLPIVTLVDTPGAYAGKAAEELGQVNSPESIHLIVPLVEWFLSLYLHLTYRYTNILVSGWQGEAIAYNLREMFGLRVPILSLVIGEGGSGGALAIGCANRNLILENSVYYVASPEACAAILWKNRGAAGQVWIYEGGGMTK